jgi:hypothetical protein
VDVTTDDATDACSSSEGATPGSVRASIHRGEADAAADPELATAVRGCQHGDASSSWMVRARGLLRTSCREWRVLAPLTVFLGMSVAAENTVGGWIYTMASHGEADLSSAASSSVNSTMWASFTATLDHTLPGGLPLLQGLDRARPPPPGLDAPRPRAARALPCHTRRLGRRGALDARRRLRHRLGCLVRLRSRAR